MSRYEFDWVDAFTQMPFGGNGCAVVYDAQDLPISDRMALVCETKLSECAFLVGSDKADFGVRYYLVDQEILMAGHPTVATIRSLIHRELIDVSTGRVNLTLEVGSGVLPIEIVLVDGEPLITMTQQRPDFGELISTQEIEDMFGLQAGDVLGAPQLVSTGTAFCIAVLKSRQALDSAQLDGDKLKAWQSRLDIPVVNPFLVVLEGAENGDTFARLLFGGKNQQEDPFTGSATGCMAAYLWAIGLIDKPKFVAEQGHGMGRPGQAMVEVLGPRDDISGVRVGGYGTVLMQGHLII